MSPEQRLIRTMVQSFAEIIERQVLRFENQSADYERKLAEHRTSFAARTSADEKIIEWLRIKVQDARAERDALRAEVAALQERLRASIARGDFAQMEVAALKSQTPKQHPVKVGEWVRRTSFEHSIGTRIGAIAQVIDMDDDGDYEVAINGTKHCWSPKYCTPCDPPKATHDTEAGKAAAEAALTTEPVAEEIKVGDVVKVRSASGDNTAKSDIGKIGEVRELDSQDGTVLLSGGAGWVSRCDIRKVTT